jgi:hypothetical protein
LFIKQKEEKSASHPNVPHLNLAPSDFVCQEILSQKTFTKTLFSPETYDIYVRCLGEQNRVSQLDKIAGILLIALLAIVTAVSLSYYVLSQPNQTSNNTSPTPTPTSAPTSTPSPSEIPSVSKSSVPEFTLKFVDNTVQAKIKNNIGASYYNFRFKVSYTDEWTYYPFSPSSSGYGLGGFYSIPYEASNSSYTVAELPSYFFEDIPERGQVDIQVQALFGGFRSTVSTVFAPQGTAYDFYFEGTTSDWSSTRTIEIP